MFLKSKYNSIARERRNYHTNTCIKPQMGNGNIRIELKVRLKDESDAEFRTRLLYDFEKIVVDKGPSTEHCPAETYAVAITTDMSDIKAFPSVLRFMSGQNLFARGPFALDSINYIEVAGGLFGTKIMYIVGWKESWLNTK